MPRESIYAPNLGEAGKDVYITIVNSTGLLGAQKFHCLIQAGNNRVLFRTEKYYNRADVESAAHLLTDPTSYTVKIMEKKGWVRGQRFWARIQSKANHRIRFGSETYYNREDVEHAIQLLSGISDMTPIRYRVN